jgi:maltose phosphorylase
MYGFVCDPWKIIQTRLNYSQNRVAESLFTLGNEYMGLRGFFEESYSGDTLPGIYVGGVYYPDKTRVGWWKNGYPAYFAKVPNSINWAGLSIRINGQEIDLAKHAPFSFRRELDMQNGSLTRNVVVEPTKGSRVGLTFQRFLSMDDRHVAFVSVSVTPMIGDAGVEVESYLDGDVRNQDANYDETFWTVEGNTTADTHTYLAARTKKTGFLLGVAQSVNVLLDDEVLDVRRDIRSTMTRNGFVIGTEVKKDSTLIIDKYVAVYTSRDIPEEEVAQTAIEKAQEAKGLGYDVLYPRHKDAMAAKWEKLDVQIMGDDLAQQGIRYGILQLFQTYYGYDPALNIGPKGFSGEKYGGVAYWDTEAFCFPFYLYNDSAIALNLLLYRYRQLDKAKENAAKLGLRGALYPMVTVNGEECHNEWEITFEEIHRNGAIAYAIYHYTRYTGDDTYLMEKGVEVLVELCRFWASRVTFSSSRNKYVILGVTGPNEYENNVNNNWYTNTMAAWTLTYTLDVLEDMEKKAPERFEALEIGKQEPEKWRSIADGMYFPYDEFHRVFEQQDLFNDKELKPASSLKSAELPLSQHWSWDRILRSCFIKQADVLQGIYFFPERYDTAIQKRNFLFYEPMTVHESSLSASIHSIIASRIGLEEKAYELYLRTARLDLEDINKDTEDGIHLTSMAGTWNAIVQGFAGLDFAGDKLTLCPYLPPQWEGYSFRIVYRGTCIGVTVDQSGVEFKRISGPERQVVIKKRDGEDEIVNV